MLLLDIDNTLTPPRQPLPEAMADILSRLNVPFHVVAGSHLALLEQQFFVPLYSYGFRKKFDAFVSNGAIHYRCDYSSEMSLKLVSAFDIRDYLGDTDYSYLVGVLKRALVLREFELPSFLKILGERITFRGSMINLCPIGRVEQETIEAQHNRRKFAEFDRAEAFRKKMMEHLNEELSDLTRRRRLKITLGGETSFDIGIEDEDKTKAIRTLLQNEVKKLIFVGDALFEGGNDAVISVFIRNWSGTMPCPVQAIPVTSWKETINKFHELKLIDKQSD